MWKFWKLTSIHAAASVAVAHSSGKGAPSQDAVAGEIDCRLAEDMVPWAKTVETAAAKAKIERREEESIMFDDEAVSFLAWMI